MRSWIAVKGSFALLALHIAGLFIYYAGETSSQLPQTLSRWVYQPIVHSNRRITNLKFQIRGTRSPEAPIVIVGANEPDLIDIGRWPWGREIIAEIVEEIFAKGAQSLSFDMVFSGRERHISAPFAEELEGRGLSDLISRYDPNDVLLKTFFRHRKKMTLGWNTYAPCRPSIEDCHDVLSKSVESFQDFKRFGDKKARPHSGWSFLGIDSNDISFERVIPSIGYFNTFKEADGHVLSIPLVIEQKGHWFHALSLATALRQDSLDFKIDDKNFTIWHGNTSTRLNSSAELPINYLGGESTIPTLSIGDLFSDDPKVDEALNGAIVFFGVTAESLLDAVATPFDATTPGIEVHATLAENLISGKIFNKHLGVTTALLMLFFLFISWLLTLSAYAWLRGWRLFVGVSVVGIGIFFVDMALFSSLIYLPTVLIWSAFATTSAYAGLRLYLSTEKDKVFLKQAFSRYVSEDVVKQLVQDPRSLRLGGEKRELTVLFSDIRGFTTLSEKMNPEALATFLNDYLSLMTDIIQRNRGTLDKYIGDAVMAFWGAPLSNLHHSSDAVRACIEMIECLNEHRDRLENEYGARLEVGIGLNTGVVSVGNMGSQMAFNYTVLGDDVNLASRLEGLTKYYGSQLLISGKTFQTISSSLKAHCRLVDRVRVKGKNEPVELYDVSIRPLKDIQAFTQARELYFQGQWKDAAAILDGLNQDAVSQALWERLKELDFRPPEDWAGVWTFQSK